MKKFIIPGVIVVLLIVITLLSINTVDDGQIMVAEPGFLFKETRILQPGTHFLFPLIYKKTTLTTGPVNIELTDQVVFTSKFNWKRIIAGKLTYKIDIENVSKLSRIKNTPEEYIISKLNEAVKKYFFPMDEISPSKYAEYSAALKEKLAASLQKAGLEVIDYKITAIRIDYGEEKLNRITELKKQWEKKKRRLILVGMDALDLRIMQKLLDRGELPNFRKLLKGGTSGVLRSMYPMLSPLIWTTIATGKLPDEHGILDFVQKDAAGKLVPITSNMRKVPAVWNILSTLEIPVGFVAWWATWPAEEVEGFMVSERLEYQLFNLDIDPEQMKSSEGKMFPESDYKEAQRLAKRFSNVSYEDISRFIKISASEWNSAKNKSVSDASASKIVMLKQLITSTEAYHEISLKLYKKYKPVLFSPYFEGTDVIGHLFMEYRPPKRKNVSQKDFDAYNDAVPEYYRYIDKILGDYIALVDDKTDLMIVSDHGFKSGADRPYSSADIKGDTAVEWHDISGTFIFYGTSFKKGHIVNGASVKDILPTVLATLNLPPAENMPGKVIADAFITPPGLKRIESYDSFVPTHGKTIETTGSAYDEEIIKNLEALGYIDTGAGKVSSEGETIMKNINKAGSLISSKKYKEAKELLLKILDDDPRIGPAWTMLAQLYNKTGEEDKEYEVLLKILANSHLQSENEFAVESATKILSKRRKPREALELTSRALGRFPESYVINEAHARMLFVNRRVDEGIKACEKLLSMRPDDYFAMMMMAEGYYVKGNMKKADEIWNRAFKINPDQKARNLNYHMNRGNIHMRERNFSAAAASYKIATGLQPQSHVAWYQLAISQLAARNISSASRAMENALKYARDNQQKARAYAGFATIYNAQGNTQKESEALKAGYAADPENALILRMMAIGYMKENKVDKAVPLFERILKKNPNDWNTMNSLGSIYIQQGKISEGLELLRRSLKINPNQPRLKQTLDNLSK